MSASEHAPDLLSTMPMWVQISANLGMFVVAVIAGAFGFFRKHAPAFSTEHFAEGGALSTFAEDVKAIADALKGMHAIMQDHERQESVEREVQRRLAEERGKH